MRFILPLLALLLLAACGGGGGGSGGGTTPPPPPVIVTFGALEFDSSTSRNLEANSRCFSIAATHSLSGYDYGLAAPNGRVLTVSFTNVFTASVPCVRATVAITNPLETRTYDLAKERTTHAIYLMAQGGTTNDFIAGTPILFLATAPVIGTPCRFFLADSPNHAVQNVDDTTYTGVGSTTWDRTQSFEYTLNLGDPGYVAGDDTVSEWDWLDSTGAITLVNVGGVDYLDLVPGGAG